MPCCFDLNGLMFRTAATRDPESFVRVNIRLSGQWQREFHGPPTLATLEDLAVVRRATSTLAAVTASRWATFALGDSQTAQLRGKFVSCDYLSAHIGPMHAGRGLGAADCARPGGEPVVVLTRRGWQLHFAGDLQIIGARVRLNDSLLTVVGIAPDDSAGDPSRRDAVRALHAAAGAARSDQLLPRAGRTARLAEPVGTAPARAIVARGPDPRLPCWQRTSIACIRDRSRRCSSPTARSSTSRRRPARCRC